MASTVFTEARGLGTKAQQAVAEVAVGRAKRQGKTICQVVAKGWYGAKDKVSDIDLDDEIEAQAWVKAVMISIDAMAGKTSAAPGATHLYQHTKVKPAWASKMVVVARYGSLTFVREV